MKNHKKIFACLIGFLSQLSYAGSFVETNPKAIEAYKAQGVGQIYNFNLNNGVIKQMKITKLSEGPDQGTLLVEAEPIDNKSFIFFEEGLDTENPNEAVARNKPSIPSQNPPSDSTGSLTMGFEVGVEGAAIAGIQSAIIESTHLLPLIEKGFERLNQLEKELGDEFSKVQQGSIDLNTSMVNLLTSTEIRGASPSPSSTLPSSAMGVSPPTGFRSQEGIQSAVAHSYKTGVVPTWLTKDPDFILKADQISQKLNSRRPKDSIEEKFSEISHEALLLGDHSSYLGNKEEARNLLSIAETAADVLVGLDPFTGEARSIYEAFTGTNLITGKTLSEGERALAVFGIFSGGFISKSPRFLRMVEKISERVNPLMKGTLNFSKGIFSKLFKTAPPVTTKSFQILESKALRDIQWRHSLNDHKWGLTRTHLNKHFFGPGKWSLRNLDPSGTPDKWIQEIMELTQRDPDKKIGDIIEVSKSFPRADGKGNYMLGLRLAPQKNGQFDLVTVLTDQTRFRH